MKALKTILATTLTLWVVQLLFFVVLFVGWFIRFILQWFVGFGSPQPETSFEALLQTVMKILTYPVRLFFADQFGTDTFTLALQCGISSVIWVTFVGLFVYAIWKIRRANAA